MTTKMATIREMAKAATKSRSLSRRQSKAWSRIMRILDMRSHPLNWPASKYAARRNAVAPRDIAGRRRSPLVGKSRRKSRRAAPLGKICANVCFAGVRVTTTPM